MKKWLPFLIVFWVIGELIIRVRGQESYFLWDTLPFSSHSQSLPPIYTLAAIAMIVIFIRGLKNMKKKGGVK
jgi:hypothetical protein